MKSRVRYQKGVLSGPFQEFNSQGQLVMEGTYKKGQWHGKLRQYDQSGLLAEKRYKKGELIEKDTAHWHLKAWLHHNAKDTVPETSTPQIAEQAADTITHQPFWKRLLRKKQKQLSHLPVKFWKRKAKTVRVMGKGKLKAGVLSLALVVSVVVAAIGSSMILASYYFQINTLDYKKENQLTANLQSAWALLLADFDQLTYEEAKYLDLYGTGEDSVKLIKKPWGILDVGLVYAVQGKKSKRQAAVIGSSCDSLGKSVLYLADEQRPLSLAGNTLIKGRAYLLKQA